MATPPFDLAVAHRWFAIELNNLAWDLIEAPARSPEEVERMLSAAHASRLHWYEVGTLLNQLRAESLVAAAYLAAQLPELSLSAAETCYRLSEQAGEEQSPFDRATVHGGLAAALAALGRREEAREQYAAALAAIERAEDPDDKPVFEKLYPPVG